MNEIEKIICNANAPHPFNVVMGIFNAYIRNDYSEGHRGIAQLVRLYIEVATQYRQPDEIIDTIRWIRSSHHQELVKDNTILLAVMSAACRLSHTDLALMVMQILSARQTHDQSIATRALALGQRLQHRELIAVANEMILVLQKGVESSVNPMESQLSDRQPGRGQQSDGAACIHEDSPEALRPGGSSPVSNAFQSHQDLLTILKRHIDQVQANYQQSSSVARLSSESQSNNLAEDILVMVNGLLESRYQFPLLDTVMIMQALYRLAKMQQRERVLTLITPEKGVSILLSLLDQTLISHSQNQNSTREWSDIMFSFVSVFHESLFGISIFRSNEFQAELARRVMRICQALDYQLAQACTQDSPKCMEKMLVSIEKLCILLSVDTLNSHCGGLANYFNTWVAAGMKAFQQCQSELSSNPHPLSQGLLDPLAIFIHKISTLLLQFSSKNINGIHFHRETLSELVSCFLEIASIEPLNTSMLHTCILGLHILREQGYYLADEQQNSVRQLLDRNHNAAPQNSDIKEARRLFGLLENSRQRRVRPSNLVVAFTMFNRTDAAQGLENQLESNKYVTL